MGLPFGVGVGDVIAVATLAHAVFKRFADSGDQFEAIRSEVAGLSLVLQDVSDSMKLRELSEQEDRNLNSVLQGCQDVLDALKALINEFHTLRADSGSFKAKSQKAWKKFTWDDYKVAELRSRITSNVAMLNALNGSLTRKQTQAGVTEITQHHKGLQLNEKHQQILDWLSPTDYSTQQNDSFARRQDGTGTWLLESPKFKTWIDGTKQTLFCPGIPGAGKTIMSSIVTDHLRNTFREENVGVAFIYCRYTLHMEQTPLNILSSLLRQLIQGHDLVSGEASTLYKAHLLRKARPTLKEVCDLLEIEASRYSKVFIVLDALDECSNTDGMRRDILSRIHALQSKQAVNLAATSRLIPTIIQDFEDAVRLDIKASEADVRKYLQGQMHRLPTCVTRNASLKEDVEREIVKAADGMFLLAQLHLDSLEDKLTPKAIKTALSNLPKGSRALDVAYDEVIQRINHQKQGFRELADQVLIWIIFALRPLTVLELQHALAVEQNDTELDEDNLPNAKEMIAFCAGLVVVDEESQIIRLVHYTTQEYFERVWEHRSMECHNTILKTCLTYISFYEHKHGRETVLMNKKRQVVVNEKRQDPRRDKRSLNKYIALLRSTHRRFESLLDQYPLLKYNAIHWIKHAKGMSSEPIRTMTLEFLLSPSRLNVATELMYWTSKGKQRWPLPSLTALQFAAGFGSKEVVETLLDMGFTADANEDTGTTPLYQAVYWRNEAVVKLLLTRNDVDVNNSSNGKTALSCATFHGYDTIVDDLLGHPGIDVNGGKPSSEKPLSLAATYGHETTVKLLLAHSGIEVNATDGNGSTALHRAAMRGHDRVVETLLAHPGIEINPVNLRGQTPVLCAMDVGSVAVCKLLLSRDDVIVRRPCHDQQSSGDEMSPAAARVWAMWDEGRLPEFTEAEKKELEERRDFWWWD